MILWIILIAASVSFVRWWVEGHAGLSLWDEGFLWYGVERVLHGEIPVRDFGSYDPGRYYWAAFWLKLFHAQGIIAIRAATYGFAFVGLVCAGWLVLQSKGRTWQRMILAMAAIVLVDLWMVPWWKNYDASASLILVASLVRIFQRPILGRFFVHGVIVGLIAVLGRNHGLYALIACAVALPVLIWKRQEVAAWRRCIPAWVGGVVLGYSPILIGLLSDHEFAYRFWQRIHWLFVYKRTNLPLPVPWPWNVHTQLPFTVVARELFVGLWFLLLPAFCIGSIVALFACRRQRKGVAYPVLAACAATMIPYLNVAFSRADVSHLTQASLPCLIGLLVCVRPDRQAWRRVLLWIGAPLLVLASLSIALPLHRGYMMHTQDDWRSLSVDSDKVWASPHSTMVVHSIRALAHKYLKPGETLLAAPVWPGAYALLGVRSPVWDIYPLHSRTQVFQEEEIARLCKMKPQLVLINDIAVDSRDSTLYSNTNPLVWAYIQAHYHRIEWTGKLPRLQVYVPKFQMSPARSRDEEIGRCEVAVNRRSDEYVEGVPGVTVYKGTAVKRMWAALAAVTAKTIHAIGFLTTT